MKVSVYQPRLWWNIMTITWSEYLAYRLNFILWRVRMVIQLIVLYTLWEAIYRGTEVFLKYSRGEMLSYIFVSSVLRTLTLSTTTMEIGSVISQGNLTQVLLRPIHFFQYYAVRDIADKALNFIFSCIEIICLFLLFRPSLIFATSLEVVLCFVIAIGIGAVLYFLFSLLIGCIGFWTPEVWAPRFLSFVLIEFFSGVLLPLDMLPGVVGRVAPFLPFASFAYVPARLFVGQMSTGQYVQEILPISLLWIILMYGIVHAIWRLGLRRYTADGR